MANKEGPMQWNRKQTYEVKRTKSNLNFGKTINHHEIGRLSLPVSVIFFVFVSKSTRRCASDVLRWLRIEPCVSNQKNILATSRINNYFVKKVRTIYRKLTECGTRLRSQHAVDLMAKNSVRMRSIIH